MFSRLPPVTKALLLANVLIFLLQQVLPDAYLAPLRLWPFDLGRDLYAPSSSFMPWQLLTHAFMHGDLLHIAMNMICLLMFGAELESHWGSRRYLIFYAFCTVGAGLCQVAVATLMVSQGAGAYSTLGASGGVFGLLIGYAMHYHPTWYEKYDPLDAAPDDYNGALRNAPVISRGGAQGMYVKETVWGRRGAQRGLVCDSDASIIYTAYTFSRNQSSYIPFLKAQDVTTAWDPYTQFTVNSLRHAKAPRDLTTRTRRESWPCRWR